LLSKFKLFIFINYSLFLIKYFAIMASKPANQLNASEKEQLAVSYAAFVLSGQGAQVTADSIKNVLKAANLTAS
jgi:hypothetical protein